MEVVRKIRSETLLIIVLCLAAFFVNNSALTTDAEEAKTIVTARDILAKGNWMAPTMNGESRLATPPLAAWVAALVDRAYPDNISVQRAVPALLATLWTLFFFGVARYMERRRGFAELATFVFLTCYNVIYVGRMVSRDIYCFAFMMGGIYFLMRLCFDERYYARPHRWRWAWLAGIMMGLAFLANGLVAFYSMLLPFAITTIALKRPDMEGKWRPLILSGVVALVTFGWWYVHLFANHPEAITEVLRAELAPWVSGKARPWYYYWRFFSEMGVWGILALAALAVPYWSKRVSTKRPYLMAVLWLACALLLLSLMPEKSMDELVVMTPPYAIAVACVIYYFIEKRKAEGWAKVLFSFNGYFIALLILILPLFIHVRMTDWKIIDFGTAVCTNVLLVAVGVYIAVSTSRKEMLGVVRGIVALFIVAECLLLPSIGELVTNSHQRNIGVINSYPDLARMPIYHSSKEDVRMELVYQAKRPILPLDLTDRQAVLKALPCILITQEGLSDELDGSILESMDTLRIGIFDSNRLPRSSRHYRRELVNQLSVLKPVPKETN